MNIHLDYTLTVDEFQELQRAYIKNRRAFGRETGRGSGATKVIAWIVIVFVAAILLSVLQMLFPGHSSSPSVVPSAPPTETSLDLLPYVAIFLVLWFIFFRYLRSKKRLKPIFDDMGKLADPHDALLTDTHLTIRQPGCTTEMEWSYFFRFIETPSTFLLFVGPRIAHILPKRAFTDAARDEFRAFAQAHIGKSPTAFPVELTPPLATPAPLSKSP